MNIENTDELIVYLAQGGHLAPGEAPAAVRVLAGGVSNRAVLLERAGGPAWVIKQALPQLRVQAEWYSDPARILREGLGIRWLPRFTPPGTIPALIFEDAANHILAMAAVPQPHTNWKHMLLAGDLQAEHVRQFALILAGIHSGSAAARAAVEPVFSDRSFFESLRVEPYYSYTAQQQPQSAAFYASLIAETRAQAAAIVHGDYSPKNILVHHGRLILLDHEVIHFGDPAFDVGFSMAHLLSKAHFVAQQRPAFVRAAHEYWQAYQANTSPFDGLEQRAARHTLGCLLARIDGRSPLEYFAEAHRSRQRRAALHLMASPPAAMPALIDAFIQEIAQ